ncbi:MAG: hypothetical protein AAFU85_17815 [Planctomycetota bacterium]
MRYRLLEDGSPITFAEFLRLLKLNRSFRDFFRIVLTDVPYGAFRWETPAVTADCQHQVFEFVLLDSPGLERKANPAAFMEHFLETQDTNSVLSFPNIGRNAQMIVPCPTKRNDVYTHLASFLRGAPDEQIDRLWTLVGQETERLLGEQPRWLNTAGGGVPWLHVRIDSKPKYYRYTAYKSSPFRP